MRLIKRASVLSVILFFSASGTAGEYDFSYRDRNDMRGAWLMCAMFAFTPGKCPKVLRKCWLPPMIYLKRHNLHYHVKSHCLKMPDFTVSQSDVDRALQHSSAIAQIPVEDVKQGDIEDHWDEQGTPTKADLYTDEMVDSAACKVTGYRNEFRVDRWVSVPIQKC